MLLKEIEKFIKDKDDYFSPLLSSRVDIKDYANKIHDMATIVSKRNDGHLVALLAFYKNTLNNEGYITYFAVDKYFSDKGIGKELLQECIYDCKLNKINLLRLEVSLDNKKAISLYDKFGFKFESYSEDDTRKSIKMVCIL